MDVLSDHSWVDEERYHFRIPPELSTAKKLTTVKAAIFQAILVLAYMIFALVCKYTNGFDEKCDDIVIMMFYQVALWAIGFIIHHYYLDQHHNLRIRGYNTFYKRLMKISSYKVYLLSWWNSFTLLYMSASLKYASNEFCDWNFAYSAINLTLYSVLAHGFIFLCIIFVYANDVITFNRMNPISDIESIEVWRQELGSGSGSLGYGQDNEELTRLLEKQSYIIEFYQTMNEELMMWVSSLSPSR